MTHSIRFFILFIFLLLGTLAAQTTYSAGTKTFTLTNPENTRNIMGDFAIIGNTIEPVTQCQDKVTISDIPDCPIAYSDNVTYFNNNYLTIATENNSSSARLKLPQNAKKIIWGMLIWRASLNNFSFQGNYDGSRDSHFFGENFSLKKKFGRYLAYLRYKKRGGPNSYYYKLSNDYTGDIKTTGANELLLNINGTTIPIQADEIRYLARKRYFCKLPQGCSSESFDENDYIARKGVIYQGTKILDEETLAILNQNLEEAKSDSGLDIEVSNIKATWGIDGYQGDFGSWTLIVIHESEPLSRDDDSQFKNISIYTGFENLGKKTKTIDITNLVLPESGEVTSQLATVASEGEEKFSGDYIKLNGEQISNNNVFDSQLSDSIERTPSLSNNNGIDIDIFDTSQNMTELRDSDTSRTFYDAEIEVTSDEGLFLELVAFSTRLYQPKVCYIERLYTKDGEEIGGDNYTVLKEGDEINASVLVRNDGEKTAMGVKIVRTFEDQENASTQYKHNTLYVKNTGEEEFVHQTDAEGDDLGSYIEETKTLVIHLGVGANEREGGTFAPNMSAAFSYGAKVLSSVNFQSVYQASYTYKIADQVFTYTGTIYPCEDINKTIVTYIPPLGIFNVVDVDFNSQIDPEDPSDPRNALFTQIVNKSFAVKVVKLSHDKQTLKPYKGLVRLDLIETPANENECATKQSLWRAYPTFNNRDSNITSGIVHPKAKPNMAFRVTYLSDENGNAIVGDRGCEKRDYKCIWGMMRQTYLVRYSTQCETGKLDANTECPCITACDYEGYVDYIQNGGTSIRDDEASQECLECLFSELSASVCSRDNFAIRPKAFLAIGPDHYQKAGEPFTLTLMAVDEGNLSLADKGVLPNQLEGIPDYNETIASGGSTNFEIIPKFWLSSPSDLNATDQNTLKKMYKAVYGEDPADIQTAINAIANCPDSGVITPSQSTFRNGEADVEFTFSETGIIKLIIQEKDGTEYAIVDRDDPQLPNKNSRFIDPAVFVRDDTNTTKTNLLIFLPYQITTTADTIDSSTGANWVYISSEVNNSLDQNTTPKMAAFIGYKIEAQNKDGDRVQNFHKTCYPDITAFTPNGLRLHTTFDLNLTLTLEPNKDLNLTFYVENNQSQRIEGLPANAPDSDSSLPKTIPTPSATLSKNSATTIYEWIGPLSFDHGIGKPKIYFNMDKNRSKPVAPITITIKDINTTTPWKDTPRATNIFNGAQIDEDFTLYYARLNIPQQEIEGNSGSIFGYYEIYLPPQSNDPEGLKSEASPDGVDWFVNGQHSTPIDGNISTPPGSALDSKITLTALGTITSGKQQIDLRYSGTIFPYAKLIFFDTQEWLLFDPYDEKVDKVPARVIFTKQGDWLGKSEDRNFSSDVEFDPSKKEHRRVLW